MLPLERFWPQLKNAGFEINTARRLRILRVLAAYKGNVPGLKFALAPFLCRSAEEQRTFYELFDQFWKECEAEAAAERKEFEERAILPDEPVSPYLRDDSKPNGLPGANELTGKSLPFWKGLGSRMNTALYLLLAVLLIIAGVAFWYLLQPTPKVAIIIREQLLKNSGKSSLVDSTSEFAFHDFTHSTVSDKPALVEPHPQRPLFFREGVVPDLINGSANLDTSAFEWKVVDLKTGAVEFRDSSFDFRWIATGAGQDKLIILSALHQRYGLLADTITGHIKCGNTPKAHWKTFPISPVMKGTEVVFEVEAEADCQVTWGFLDSDITDTTHTPPGPSARHQFLHDGAVTIQASIYRSGFDNVADCVTTLDTTLFIGSDKPYLALFPLYEDEPRQADWTEWLLMLTTFITSGFFFFKWWKKRRTPPTIDLSGNDIPVRDVAPYNIPYLPQESKIVVPRQFFRMADVLRRREESGRRHFDPKATALATAARGGYPSWREQAAMRPAEYLFLVERPDPRHQQGRLFERLTDFLKHRDVPAEVFFHDGSFNYFWNDAYPDGLEIIELYRRWPEHRLVLLGAAYGLVATGGDQPCLRAKPMKVLERWSRRLLLTPESVSAPLHETLEKLYPSGHFEQPELATGWSFQEALLYQHFLLYPADTEGMSDGFEMLDRTEEYQPGDFDKWQTELADTRSPENYRYRDWTTVAAHEDYLADDDEALRWLRALSVCLLPDWALTLAIGEAIGVEVTHDRLLRLTRIPWLSENTPDEDLRLKFLRQVSKEDAHAARTAVAAELEAVREATENGFAEIERHTALAVHRFVLDPRDAAHREILRDMLRRGLLGSAYVRELNLLVREKFDRVNMPDAAFESLDAFIDAPIPEEEPTSLSYAIIFLLLGLIQLIPYINLGQSTQATPTIQQVSDYEFNRAVELNNQAVQIANAVMANTTFDIRADSATRADSLFGQAMAARLPAKYPLAASNQSAFRFNRAATMFRLYLDGQEPDKVALPYLKNVFSDLANSQLPGSPLRLAALHGQGLYQFYSYQSKPSGPDSLESVVLLYQKILLESDSLYFDTLRLQMPVNLETLLLQAGKIKPFRKTQVAANPTTCRQIANVNYAVALRSRSLSAAEIKEIAQNPNGPLDRQTLLGTVSLGRTVDLLDSTNYFWKVRYGEKTGYIARTVNGKPLLAPCDPVAPPAPDLQAILAEIQRNMVSVEGSNFTMGSPDDDKAAEKDEKPAHLVTLSDFDIGQTEVTIGQYLAFCEATQSHYPEWLETGNDNNIETGTNDYYKKVGMSRENKNYPITGVSWDDAVAYCKWLSQKIPGKKFRLPTEAEWEYAARGGVFSKKTTYSGSDNIEEVAWYDKNAGSKTHPIGQKKANELGLYDMSGNVWEWCNDWYGAYPAEAQTNPASPADGSYRVVRGGSWFYTPAYARVANRYNWLPALRYDYLGFRLARTR